MTKRKGSLRAPKHKPWYRRVRLTVELLEDRNLLDSGLAGLLDLSGLIVDFNAYAAERILVQYQPGVDGGAFLKPGASAATLLPLVPNLYEVSLLPGVTVEQALAAYRSDPLVVYAEPDHLIQLMATPNDPSFGSLWGLHNTGQNSGKVDADIDAPEAWDITTGSGNFIVAVIDTGVDYNHPDLAANMWVNPGEIAGNGIDDDGNGYIDDVYGYDFANNDSDPFDDHGHGTHVAGILGAVGNNAIGVTGVNWKVKIMALKFLNANGSGYTSDAVKAINYAVSMGVKVSNNSWGGGGFDQTLYNAINNARLNGHIFVAAAGNSGMNNDVYSFYPANYSLNNIISVAATDRNDNLASFSNYGSTTVDLAAPGVSILSTTPKNTYSTYSGTSMATPFVTGAVALVWDYHPNWSYTQVISAILNNVDPLSSLNGKVASGGRLNLAKALGTSAAPPQDTTAPTVVSAVWSGAFANSLDTLTVTFSEPVIGFTAADVSIVGPNGAIVVSGFTQADSSGSKYTISFANQTAPGLYTATIGPDLTDRAGNRMASSYTTSATINGQFVYSSNVPVPIPDAGKGIAVSAIYVDQYFPIGDLNVQIDITHTWVGDLYIRLISPYGDSIVLANRRGSSGDNFSNTIFDDEARTLIRHGRAPFIGSYKPETPLFVVDGLPAQGYWYLVVEDRAVADIGVLNSWKLTFTMLGAGVSGASSGTGSAAADDVAVDPKGGFQSLDVAAISSSNGAFVRQTDDAADRLPQRDQRPGLLTETARIDVLFASLASENGVSLGQSETTGVRQLTLGGDLTELFLFEV